DIACGSGRVMVGLREKGCHVRGIDLSPGAVESSRAKGFEVIEGNVDDFETNPLIRDFMFRPADVVVCSKCLNYRREKNALMKQRKAKTVLIHQNNPGYWRARLREKFGRGDPQYFEDLPYIAANGNSIQRADANGIKQWGESFGYHGNFVRG